MNKVVIIEAGKDGRKKVFATLTLDKFRTLTEARKIVATRNANFGHLGIKYTLEAA